MTRTMPAFAANFRQFTEGKSAREVATALLVRNAMVLILLVVICYFAYRSARFATLDNVTTILIAAAPFALIALGQTLVILTGGIDLSVGSVIAVSAMSAAWIAVRVPDQLWLAPVVATGVGLLAGAVNGLLVSRFSVPPFVATLGMLTAASGFAYAIGNGAPINGVPAGYGAFANSEVLGMKIPVLLMIVGFITFWFVLRHTTFGLRIYAIGGNASAASLAGVPTERTRVWVYLISGGLAGISGLMISSRVISGAPTLGQGYELDAIAAVVIGGASLFGGRGTVWGTLLGLMLIQTLNNGLQILVIPPYWQAVIKGALIAAAVAIDVWATRRTRS
ncbi:ABC transporter permease [Ruania alba]|uniref:Monosaccharide ABC transporter membrane protein, CUT2 family n=1 Tax=Ruania alba TaxID=648782 RepID=A0A1H5LQ77_9MICO|nr:ABC transporter permease [Ruania alba]SEE79216.1 monosaccharide ABC transporter membrane protein, CUT2 family [Ruania alba]